MFLTYNLTLPALSIAELYHCRWKVELSFKGIKQHLKIKAFYCTSEKAVKTQVWIASSVYVLVDIAKKKLNVKQGLITNLQILCVTLFEKNHILKVLSNTDYKYQQELNIDQLILFN